jgi:hypothetical protein
VEKSSIYYNSETYTGTDVDYRKMQKYLTRISTLIPLKARGRTIQRHDGEPE